MEVQSLSVFFPVFNEEENISSTVEKAVLVLEKLSLKWEVIVINDGSKDKTGEVAEDLAKRIKNVSVVHQENGGYGLALRAGFKNAKYPWVVYTDGDGQFDFSEVTKFLDKAKNGADLILGYRIKRNDPYKRLVLAKGWALVLFLFFGLKLRDVDCGFKMVHQKVLEGIPKLESKRGAMINAELAIKAEKFGFKIAQVGVNHYPRLFGKPTGASMKVIINSFIEVFKLWWKLSRKVTSDK